MSLPQDAAKMARDGGIQTPKLAPNAFTTDKIFQIGQGEFIGRNNTQTGNGNVNATQSYPDISLTSSLSAPSNATTAWKSLSAYLNQVAATNNRSNTNITLRYFGPQITPSLGNGSLYAGVLTPNGKIYYPGTNSSIFCVLDPNTETFSTYAGFAGVVGESYGGVLAPNGKIYCTPGNSSLLKVIDPSNNTVTVINSTFPKGPDNTNVYYIGYQGGVLAPNGKIYFIPNWINSNTSTRNTIMRVVDPTNDTVSSINGVYGGHSGGCVAPNGKIYCAPSNYSIISIIDPSTSSVSSIFAPSSIGTGFALAPNGKLYCISSFTSSFLVVDPATDTCTTYPATGGYLGQVLGSDGRIYGVNYATATATFVGIIDPDANTFTTLSNLAISMSNANYTTGLLHPNGKIYFGPHVSASASLPFLTLNFNTNNNFNQNVCLSPFYNKA